MDTRQLRAFCEVVERKSFSQAAGAAQSLDDWEAAHRTRIDTILADHGHTEAEGEDA